MQTSVSPRTEAIRQAREIQELKASVSKGVGTGVAHVPDSHVSDSTGSRKPIPGSVGRWSKLAAL